MIKWLRALLTGVCKDCELNTQDIQEPVISFIKCFKANPKRFVFRWDLFDQWMVDTTTMEVFKFRTDNMSQTHPLICVNKLDLNRDELDYLYTNINTIIDSRIHRRDHILKLRKNRSNIKNRERLTNIYK